MLYESVSVFTFAFSKTMSWFSLRTEPVLVDRVWNWKRKTKWRLFWRTDWTRWNEIGFIPLTYESLDSFVFKLAWWLVICPAHASWLNLCLHKEGVLLSLSLSQYLIKFFSLIILVRWHSFIFKFNLIPYNQWYTHNNQWLTHNSKFTTAS